MKHAPWFVVTSALALAVACSAGGGADPGGLGSGSKSSSGSSPSSGSSTGAGAGTGSGGTIGIGGLTGTPDGGPDAEVSCASTSQEANAVPLDLFILLDQSGSMTLESNRWDPVTTALKSVVQNPAFDGIGVGLNYFPLGATIVEDPAICLPANYVTPAVPIADLPGNAAALVSSIDAHYFTEAQGEDPAHWGTPTRPAVEGVLQHLAPYQAAHPDRRLVLLLATDGKPSTQHCTGNSIAGIAEVLAAAAATTPPILTYVIGIGEIENLNELAVAGGTGPEAFIVDGTGANTEQQFAAALDSIRRLALPCEYPIPAAQSGEIDPTKVNVEHRLEGAGAGTIFPKVVGMADCVAGQTNWYYDNDDAPTAIIMCPAACDALNAGGRIDLVFGCDTEVAVPK